MAYFRKKAMPGRKRYARKYISKRKAVRKAKKSNFAKAVKAVMAGESETKEIYHTTGDSLVMFNGVIDSTGDYQQIVPAMAAGVNDNQRIGQVVTARSLNIKGHIKLNVNMLSGTSADGTSLPNVVARLMVLSLKSRSTWPIVNTSAIPLGTLLNKGGTTTGFNGRLTDIYAPINTEVFTVHSDKRFYLNQEFVNAIGVSAPSTYISQDIKNTVKFFNINVKCKNKKLKYDEDEGLGLYPNNFAPFLVLGYAFLDGSSADSISTNLGLSYVSTLRYDDC